MRKDYKTPKLIPYGPIANHTFQTPGVGDKSGNTTYELDKYTEYSHPAAS